MSPRNYILIYGEGIAIVTDAELSRLCAAGKQWFKLRVLRLDDETELEPERVKP
jgi:hypothetical protein